MQHSPIYLDYNATAPLKPEALARMQELLPGLYNASSVHRFGRTAKKLLEDARAVIAEAVSVWPNEVIFTASGTEANCMALRGVTQHMVLVSAIEHSSVINARPNAALIPVTTQGVVELAALDAMLQAQAGPVLVSVMLANNETGIIQPIAEIAALCKRHNALMHCDAVQALGKLPLDMQLLGVDMLTISAHKCGGPLGAAALIVRQNIPIAPLLTGGGQELNRRAGTENIAAIAGFAEAVRRVDFTQMQRLRGWLDAMEYQLAAHGAVIIGKDVPRLPNTSLIIMPGVSQEVQLMQFDLQGIAVSAGSACSSGRIDISHVLTAMGMVKPLAGCAIRISGGWATRKEEIETFTEAWKRVAGKKP